MNNKLFTPIHIGSMDVRNRTWMAPISLGYESQDGTISEKAAAFYLERAKGGVGCIITDACSVDPMVPYLGNTLCFRSEESIAKFKEFTDMIHQTGAKIIPQLTHPGPESISSFFGVTPVASSDYLNSMGQQVRALTLQEIPNIIKQYATAAYQAKCAGFDGIELHCAHGYMLLGSFLSPLRNKRTDAYGGCLDNRARLLMEVIDAIKEACGKEFPIILRISGDEKDPQGNTVEDICYLVPQLVAHGIDAFEISGGTQYEHPNKIIPCHGEPEGVNVPQAVRIKAVSKVPVLVVGKINDPRRAMYLVEEGMVDGIVLGRALLADPEFVNKAKQQRFDEIAPCVSCVVGCVGEQLKQRPGGCVINPFCGKESELHISEAETKKHIAVIGGGIGGLACARILALRGHQVTIYEKSDRLGGQINLACVPPHKQELSKWIVYLTHEIERLHVEVHCDHAMTSEELKDLQVDEIVIATGGKPLIPPVEGLCDTVITGHDVLSGKVSILGGNVLVVGGGMVGMEVCETLHQRKMGPLHITMIEMKSSIGEGMAVNNLLPALQRLKQAQVTMLANTKLIRLEGNNAHIEQHGTPTTLSGFTHIVFACGTSSVNEFENCGRSVHVIGDAKEARQALEAVAEAAEIALQL